MSGNAGPGAGPEDPDRRTATVLAYEKALRELQPSVTQPSDWAPLSEFVSTDRFERTGTFRERQDWEQYVEMLTRWAASIDSFETTLLRVTESDDLVFLEIEERHRRKENVNVVSSLTVFAFDAEGSIRSLDVYLQQAR